MRSFVSVSFFQHYVWDSFMLFSSSLLWSSPFHEFTICIFIVLLMSIWVVSRFLLLLIQLPWYLKKKTCTSQYVSCNVVNVLYGKLIQIMSTKHQSWFHCLDFHTQEVQTLNKIFHCIFDVVFNDESFETIVSLKFFFPQNVLAKDNSKFLPSCDSSSSCLDVHEKSYFVHWSDSIMLHLKKVFWL